MKQIKTGDDSSSYASGNYNCKTSTTGTSIPKQKPKELVTDEQKWINYIKEYCFGGDIEIGHSEADKALRLFLISLGYSKLVNIYDKVEKWYA